MKRAGVPRKRVRRLAFVSAMAALAALAAGACSREQQPEQPAYLGLGSDTVLLPPGARITDVHVRATADPELQPDAVNARSGDVLRCSAEDGGPHALVFDISLTDAEGMSFLRATQPGPNPHTNTRDFHGRSVEHRRIHV